MTSEQPINPAAQLLADRVVIVTGAAKGLGEAHSRQCAAHGALLVMTDVDPAVAETAAQFGNRAITVEHDVTNAEQWTMVVERALSAFGRIDGLVNNAGIGGAQRSIESATVEDMEKTWRINALAPMLGMQAVIPAMKAQGGGAIVNIASAAAMRGSAQMLPYSVSKWALRGMTRCAARDLASHNIRVNVVCPGITRTPGTERIPAILDEGMRTIPLGRLGSPDQIAAYVALLLSDLGGFATGGEFLIDGGRGC